MIVCWTILFLSFVNTSIFQGEVQLQTDEEQQRQLEKEIDASSTPPIRFLKPDENMVWIFNPFIQETTYLPFNYVFIKPNPLENNKVPKTIRLVLQRRNWYFFWKDTEAYIDVDTPTYLAYQTFWERIKFSLKKAERVAVKIRKGLKKGQFPCLRDILSRTTKVPPKFNLSVLLESNGRTIKEGHFRLAAYNMDEVDIKDVKTHHRKKLILHSPHFRIANALSPTNDGYVELLLMSVTYSRTNDFYTVFLRKLLTGLDKIRIYAVNVYQTTAGEFLDHSNYIEIDSDIINEAGCTKKEHNGESYYACRFPMRRFDFHMGILFEVYYIPGEKPWYNIGEKKIFQLRTQVFFSSAQEMYAVHRKETLALMGKIFSSIIKIVDGAISVTVNTVMKVMDFTRKNPGTVIYGAAAIGALWMGHDIQKHGASIGNKFMEAYKNLEAVK